MLVSEGVLTPSVQAKLESMAKAHASAAAQVKVLMDALLGSSHAATEMTSTFGGLTQQLQNVWTIDVLAPFGEGLNEALKNRSRPSLISLRAKKATSKRWQAISATIW